MKQQFKQWLINQNDRFINDNITSILSKIDDELNIINANEEETETLILWLSEFLG
ncbi:hypothetical protein [Phocoenobacter skyensis]|uniref:Uncharacterized protein n=1 Tax=Phocoenobacter skyensis TaxID=97481 RepID=A0A1H7ZYJ6_9PAST|nr:hypothetical protein [Pasteurella skyensis]MDP8184418.1 hypothetical protein [Pasteurella skyensis]SEM63732.1 hypothetical protein SAMN05444853_13318 [Pasteurella skyensis]